MAPYKGRKVITYHRSWPNFCERFGWTWWITWSPSPAFRRRPSHTLELINNMKRENIKLILVEPYFDCKTPNSIARGGGRPGGGADAVGGRRQGSHRLTSSCSTTTSTCWSSAFPKVQIGDMDTLSFLLAPFIASLILTGIHAYLGVHVVERGVIFVDLSLAQIAALGTTIAVLYGIEPHGPTAYWISLRFTFIGAAVFSTIRGHKARIPQEAMIGICYAVASAAAILAMSKSARADRAPEGDAGRQHPHRLLARSGQDGGALRRDRPVPLTLPEEIPGDLDEPRRRPRRRACRCASGISCSTPRSDSW